MIRLTLNDPQESTLRCALVVAAERYAEHAKSLRSGLGSIPIPMKPGYVSLADQFQRQEEDADKLIDMIDNAEEFTPA